MKIVYKKLINITFFTSKLKKFESFCTYTSSVLAYFRIITPCALDMQATKPTDGNII